MKTYYSHYVIKSSGEVLSTKIVVTSDYEIRHKWESLQDVVSGRKYIKLTLCLDMIDENRELMKKLWET